LVTDRATALDQRTVERDEWPLDDSGRAAHSFDPDHNHLGAEN